MKIHKIFTKTVIHLIVSILIYIPCHGNSNQISEKGKEQAFSSENRNHSTEVVLNIKNNFSSKFKISVKIPEKFIPVDDDPPLGEIFCEFIPEEESPYWWNKIITVIQKPGTNSLADFLTTMEGLYKGQNESFLYSLFDEKGFKAAYLTAEYPACFPKSPNEKALKIPGKNEICMSKIIKDVNTFAIIQYSLRYENNSSLETVKLLKGKMLAFLKSCEVTSSH